MATSRFRVLLTSSGWRDFKVDFIELVAGTFSSPSSSFTRHASLVSPRSSSAKTVHHCKIESLDKVQSYKTGLYPGAIVQSSKGREEKGGV